LPWRHRRLGHGHFGRWCEGLSFSYETAKKYMQVARFAPQIGNGATDLSLRALLKLASAERKAAQMLAESSAKEQRHDGRNAPFSSSPTRRSARKRTSQALPSAAPRGRAMAVLSNGGTKPRCFTSSEL
jgi:hypothetical protein